MLCLRLSEDSKPPSVYVEWRNPVTRELEKDIQFIVQHFGRRRQSQSDNFFHINKYWESLPYDLQKYLFECYEKAFEEFTVGNSRQQLEKKLCVLLANILEHHKIENIEYWAAHRCSIPIPSTVTDKFEKSIDKNTSREKTYTVKDYTQLACLTIALKAVVPIWGEYASRIKVDTGDGFLDYFCFLLLKNSCLFECDAINKLHVYTEAMTGNDKNHPQNAFKSISSEDYVAHLVAGVCFRKLGLADIQFEEEKKMLVTLVYGYILQKSFRGDQYEDRDNKLTEKKPTSKNDETRPFTETYKAMTLLSLGEIVELNHIVKDPYEVAQKICYKIKPELVDLFLHNIHDNIPYIQSSAHANLLKWVASSSVSPNSHDYLSNENILKLLAICSAVLWHAGHRYMSIMLSSAVHDSGDGRYIPLADEDSKKGMSDNNYETLIKLYPFCTPIAKNKKQLKPTRLDNWTYKSIEEQITVLSGYVWRPTVSQDMYRSVFGKYSRTIPIVNDIRDKFAELVIDIGSRKLQIS